GHRDLTIGGNLLTQQQTQERRLSGAGRADEEDELTLVDLHGDEEDELTLVDLHGDVVQRGARRRLVRLGNVVEPDHDSIPYLRCALTSGCVAVTGGIGHGELSDQRNRSGSTPFRFPCATGCRYPAAHRSPPRGRRSDYPSRTPYARP